MSAIEINIYPFTELLNDILVDLLPVSHIAAKLIFYVIAASIVLFGLKAVGVSEKIAMAVIFAIVGVLAVCSFVVGKNEVPMFKADFTGCLAYYGMAMFALSAFFRLPPEKVVEFRPSATYYGGVPARRRKGSVSELLGMLLTKPKKI